MKARRVLIVDDEEAFGRFVGDVASEAGLQAEVTTSAAAFISAFDRARPDVVVLDLVMPETEGIELIRWLIDRKISVRLIVVTGFSPEYARLAAMMARITDSLPVTTLSKPVPLATLRKALLAE
ncbi:MAG TPA: response regulator [Alphaproteobacteria bacterium]|nr:response regulator [Alphaproteobacteria bacterium]